MTNDQALQEAQTRVDSFRDYYFCKSSNQLSWEDLLENAQKCATIAIETEITTVKECWTKTEDTAFISEKFHNLKSILEQIPNTL